MESLLAYPQALARHLVGLRERRGYTREHTARLLGIPATTLAQWENGTRRPSLPRLLRLTTLYQTPLLRFLDDVAREVRPPEHPSPPYTVHAFLLWSGVAPEQLHGIQPDPVTAPRHTDGDTDDEPLRDVVLYRRADDPVRINAGRQLTREYTAGASIRTLATRHRISFGTMRTLLHEAGAPLHRHTPPRHTTNPEHETKPPPTPSHPSPPPRQPPRAHRPASTPPPETAHHNPQPPAHRAPPRPHRPDHGGNETSTPRPPATTSTGQGARHDRHGQP
ncbi:helix-turn-helix domain-containing protein [Saccharothrix lopnurensis]|uniref:Helix-turn-helix domain-containing protein n=1 Tax=Saccharothrix lopnurensis TaxID=1670621 RepID=A0ABW1PGM1_9PSEU